MLNTITAQNTQCRIATLTFDRAIARTARASPNRARDAVR
jgi:hypothetical protein